MSQNLHIAADHLVIIKEILQKYLPSNTTVWVFGSRATGNLLKNFSDLDLLIDMNGQPLPWDIQSNLLDEFIESNLPYKVDIVDWNSITDSFRKAIQQAQKIMLIQI